MYIPSVQCKLEASSVVKEVIKRDIPEVPGIVFEILTGSPLSVAILIPSLIYESWRTIKAKRNECEKLAKKIEDAIREGDLRRARDLIEEAEKRGCGCRVSVKLREDELSVKSRYEPICGSFKIEEHIRNQISLSIFLARPFHDKLAYRSTALPCRSPTEELL